MDFTFYPLYLDSLRQYRKSSLPFTNNLSLYFSSPTLPLTFKAYFKVNPLSLKACLPILEP